MTAYEDMTVEELKDVARDRELAGFSSMLKDELVSALEESDAAQPQTAEKQVDDLQDVARESYERNQED